MKNSKCLSVSGVVCLLLACLPVFCSEDPTADLVGLWGSERDFVPEGRGELTIVQEGTTWRAMIAGFEAPVILNHDAITFELAGNRGEFRGRLDKDATRIIGHWIQPQSPTNDTRYATPVELKKIHSKIWRGLVVPLDHRLSLYLAIQRKTDGSFTGFLRDPVRNVGIFLRLGRVQLQGDVIHLESRRGEITGKYDKKRDTVSIALPSDPTALEFTRRTRNAATGFYPRTPSVDRYTYRQPIAEEDGWTTASLAEVGFDTKPVFALINSILQTRTDDVTTPYLQGLLIARHGKLALEEYFYGFDKERPHDTRSASKSVTTTLVGIAMDRSRKLELSTPVYSLFPQSNKFAHEDARKQKLTIEHLLTMSSGLDCDDNKDSSPGNEDNMQEQSDQPDWYKYFLNLPMVRNPGEKALYCSGGTNLLGGIVTNVEGMWLPDFLYQNLAQPLDIRRYHMNLTPTGNGYGGGGIYMRPRDFMKLGQLFLDGGRWNGRQVISRQWIERATRPHASINSENDYGYGWWLKEYRVGDKTYRGFHAAGNGGQFVIVIPELDVVVMFAGGNYGNGAASGIFRDEYLPKFIIPAIATRN